MHKSSGLLAIFLLFLSIDCEYYGYFGNNYRYRQNLDGYTYYGNSLAYEPYRRYAIPYYKFNRAYNPAYYNLQDENIDNYRFRQQYDYPYPQGFQNYYDF